MVKRTNAHCSLRLDQSCIFLPHPDENDSGCSISGTLFLSFPQDAAVKNISVQVRGIIKLRFNESGFFPSHHEWITLDERHSLASSKKMNFFMMPAGDYEFPFNIPLDEHTIETIRGPSQNQHTYQVHGIVERRLGKDIIVSEPIGIYKSPAVPLGFMMSSPALVEGSLGDLVQYNVSIPDVNIPFGSTFPVKFSLVPLSKDISLGTITLEVVEEHKIKIDAPAAYSARYNIRHLASKAKHVILAEQHEPDDYVSERPEVFEIEWCTAKKVSLPRDFASCTQSVQTGVFKINHLLAVTITVKDARGGLSMIKETIPFKIAMSPYVIGQDGTIYSVDMEELEHDSSPSPPVYNDHKKDVLLAGYQQVTETSTEDLLYRLRHHAHTPDTFRFDSNEFGSPPDYELLVANNP